MKAFILTGGFGYELGVITLVVTIALLAMLFLLFRVIPFGMMAQSYYGSDAGVNVPILSRMMQLQIWQELGHWAPMVGFIKRTQNVEVGVPGNAILPRPTGKPIEVFDDFVSEGSEAVIVPMKRVLTGPPTGGDTQLEGDEERYKVSYKRVRINADAHAVNVISGPMSKQIFKQYAKQMFQRGKDDLQDWFSRRLVRWGIQSAIFEGRSHVLTAGLEGWPGMKSLRRISHPNFFVAGTGQVAFANEAYTSLPGTQAYETAIAATLNAMAAGASTKMTAEVISLMKFSAIRKRVPQLLAGTIPFYPVVIHTSQFHQLKQDPVIKEALKDGMPQGFDKNPHFTGASIFWDGCAIYVDDTLFGPQISGGAVVTDTNGSVRYGPAITKASTNIFVPDTGDIKLAVLYGPSFLACGIGQNIRLADEVKDYGRKTNVGADMVYGFELGSYFDDDNYEGNGAGAFHENTSSIVCATFSPHQLSWT